jgi:hypothetical protein
VLIVAGAVGNWEISYLEIGKGKLVRIQRELRSGPLGIAVGLYTQQPCVCGDSESAVKNFTRPCFVFPLKWHRAPRFAPAGRSGTSARRQQAAPAKRQAPSAMPRGSGPGVIRAMRPGTCAIPISHLGSGDSISGLVLVMPCPQAKPISGPPRDGLWAAGEARGARAPPRTPNPGPNCLCLLLGT